MKTSELRGKSIEELRGEIESLRREQFNLRMQRGLGQAARPSQFQRVRRDIARAKTILNEKQRNAGAGK